VARCVASGLEEAEETTQELDMTFADRVIRLNLWYDALPELQRFLVFPTVLVIAGAINMVWTISYGYRP
jgi:hypothetical protein